METNQDPTLDVFMMTLLIEDTMHRGQGKSGRKDWLRISYWVSRNTVSHSRNMGSWTYTVGVNVNAQSWRSRARNHLYRL